MQTSIPRSGQYRAIAGMIADDRVANVLESAFNGEASAKMLFGLGVQFGAAGASGAERVTKLPSNSADIFAGIVAWGASHQPDTGSFDLVSGASGGLLPKSGFELARKGCLWVVVDPGLASLNPGIDRAWWRYSVNGANTIVGAFTNANDAGHTIDLTKVGVFRSGVVLAADGVTQVAMLDLDAVNKP